MDITLQVIFNKVVQDGFTSQSIRLYQTEADCVSQNEAKAVDWIGY
jgi:hypothetical protein